MNDSVSAVPVPVAAAAGAIEGFDFVDGSVGLIPHATPALVPRGAPIVMRGWVAQPGDCATVRDIRLLLDLARQHGTAHSSPRRRRDVPGERFGDDAKERTVWDFRGVVPTADLPAGAHEIRVVVLGDDERWYEAGVSPFTIEDPVLREAGTAPGNVRLRVEPLVDALPGGARRIAAGAVPLGHLAFVTGWAFDAVTHARVSGVQVTVGGRRFAAGCNQARADVRSSVGAESDLLGFEVAIPTESIGAGAHVATVEVVDADGRRRLPQASIAMPIARRLRTFPSFATASPSPPPCDAEVRVQYRRSGDARVLGRDGRWELERHGVLEVRGTAASPWGAPPTEVYLELQRRGALTSTRIPALTGYGGEDAPGAFSGRVGLTHEPEGPLEVAVLTLGPDRRVYARAPLGTIVLGAYRQASDEREETGAASRRR